MSRDSAGFTNSSPTVESVGFMSCDDKENLVDRQ
jgi:hypothetical protein